MDKKSKVKSIVATIVCLLVVIAICIVIYFVKNRGNVSVADDTSEVGDSIESSQTGEDEASVVKDRHIIKVNISGNIEEDRAVSLVKEVYALHFLYGINDFTDVNTLSADQIVQYSFCKIYSDSILDVSDKNKLKYREVLCDSMQQQVESVFGKNNVEIKKSPLYNAKTNSFEMWQPVYKDTVYASADVNESENKVSLKVSFCGDGNLNTIRNVIEAEYEVSDGNYTVKSLKIDK